MKNGYVLGYSDGSPLWDILKYDKLNGSNNGIYSGSSEVFKNDNPDGLFDGTLLGL